MTRRTSLLALVLALPPSAVAAQAEALHAPRPVREGVIEPRRIAPEKDAAPGTPRLIPNQFLEAIDPPAGASVEVAASSAVTEAREAAGPRAAPAVDVRFDGPIDNGVAPPDSVLAVGRAHVVALVNVRIAMYTKAGALAFGPVSLASFFEIPAGFGVFDPLAIYDPFRDRYVVAVLADNGAAQDSRIFIAFSQTGDPTGTWNRYWIDADAHQPGNWADYGSIGLDRLAVYVTANMFVRGGGYSNATLFVYDAEDGYAGRPLDNTHLVDVRTDGGGATYRLRPAYVREPVPGDAYFLAHTDSSFGDRINLWRLTGDRFASPALTASHVATPGTFLTPGGARQPITATRVDTLGTNLWNVEYRGGKLWTAQMVNTGAGAGAWVHRIAVGSVPEVREQTYAVSTPGRDTYFPYVIPDLEDDDFALATAYSGTDTFVTTRYWNVDAAGTVRAAENLADGTTVNTSKRHGDYFGMQPDPRDRNRLWMIGQFMRDSTFTANTRLASVRFEDVPATPIPPIPDTAVRVDRAAGDQVTVSWEAPACPPAGTHLVWYDLSALPGYAVAAETCGTGMSGAWTGPPPASSVAVIVVSDDVAFTEGSHGTDGEGAERPSRALACGFPAKDLSGTCP